MMIIMAIFKFLGPQPVSFPPLSGVLFFTTNLSSHPCDTELLVCSAPCPLLLLLLVHFRPRISSHHHTHPIPTPIVVSSPLHPAAPRPGNISSIRTSLLIHSTQHVRAHSLDTHTSQTIKESKIAPSRLPARSLVRGPLSFHSYPPLAKLPCLSHPIVFSSNLTPLSFLFGQ